MWKKIWFYIVDFTVPFIKDLGVNLLKIVIIIILMLVVLEILKALKVLDFLNKILYYLTKPLGISKSASMPLLIGLLAGITYGAGAIIASYTNKEMERKDVILVSIFLCICHGVIEDTLLFIGAGANGLIVVLIRFVLAIFVTIIINLCLKRIEKHNIVHNQIDK